MKTPEKVEKKPKTMHKIETQKETVASQQEKVSESSNERSYGTIIHDFIPPSGLMRTEIEATVSGPITTVEVTPQPQKSKPKSPEPVVSPAPVTPTPAPAAVSTPISAQPVVSSAITPLPGPQKEDGHGISPAPQTAADGTIYTPIHDRNSGKCLLFCNTM